MLEFIIVSSYVLVRGRVGEFLAFIKLLQKPEEGGSARGVFGGGVWSGAEIRANGAKVMRELRNQVGSLYYVDRALILTMLNNKIDAVIFLLLNL